MGLLSHTLSLSFELMGAQFPCPLLQLLSISVPCASCFKKLVRKCFEWSKCEATRTNVAALSLQVNCFDLLLTNHCHQGIPRCCPPKCVKCSDRCHAACEKMRKCYLFVHQNTFHLSQTPTQLWSVGCCLTPLATGQPLDAKYDFSVGESHLQSQSNVDTC